MAYFRSPPKMPNRAEIEAVLKVTDTDEQARDHVLISMAAMTGLRVHELVALDWNQIVTESGTVRRRAELRPADTKGNVGGDIVIGEVLRWKIAKYRMWCLRQDVPVDGAVFISRHGVRISVRRVQQVWHEVQGHAGLERPYNIHALRHFYGTSVYSKTKDIRVTQVLLRHQAVSSTQIYCHVSERDVERAVVDLF